MSLPGVLRALLADTALASAVADAREAATAVLDLTGPAALRPLVVAGLAAAADEGGAARPVLAVTATQREAEDLVEALGCLLPAGLVVDYPAWETLPHERLSPRSDTVGRRLAVLRRLVHPGPDDRRQRAGARRRRAGALGAAAAGARAGRPRAGAAARRRRASLDDVVRRSPPRPTRGSTWSSGAASSRSAAASSTCSRPPRSTRCGWSSGATRSRRSAPSRSPTSARSSWSSAASGRRPAASCC